MSDRPGGEPTEQPTEKRLKKAFKEGEIAYSHKISGVFVFLILSGAFFWFVKILVYKLGTFSTAVFSLNNRKISLFKAFDVFLDIMLPVSAAIFVAVLIAGLVQTRFRFNPHMLRPKLDRISPSKGLKRIFSLKRMTDLLFGFLFLIIVFSGVFLFWKYELPFIVKCSNRLVSWNSSCFTTVLTDFFKLLAGFALVIAGIDFYMVYKRHKKSLMMTKYEVEKEQKQDEGEPMYKSERKRQHGELLNDNLIKSVKEADVIVINPVHIAVALKQNGNEPPVVVAKGRELTAALIKKEARKHGIPVYKDVQLARNLYKVETGESIPEELFTPVALIMASLEKWEDYV